MTVSTMTYLLRRLKEVVTFSEKSLTLLLVDGGSLNAIWGIPGEVAILRRR